MSCCIRCNNREFIRASVTKNHKLLEELLNSKHVVSNIFERWAPDKDLTALDYIF